jgi:hypothetical protein
MLIGLTVLADGTDYSSAMTCFFCGRPPWQHWCNEHQGTGCYIQHCCFHHNLLPPMYLNRHTIFSHHPFVKPCFAGDPSLSIIHHPSWHENPITKCPNKVRRQRLRPTGVHTHKEVFENYPGLFSRPSELDAMAKTLDKEGRMSESGLQ